MPGMNKQRYAVIGAGALGGLYGGLLARAGFEVHFLLNRDFDHVTRHGLKVETKLGDFHLSDVHAHASPATMPACDVTIVALKTTKNDQLADLLPAPTRDGGIALVLQNGLNSEAHSVAVVGPDRVLGGCCFLCSNKVGPGHIRHIDQGRVVFGEYGDKAIEITPRVQRIADDMVSAGIDAHPTDDLPKTRWKKLMWNIPFNGLSVALDASTKQIIDDPDAIDLAEKIVREVHAGAAACGVHVAEKSIQTTIDVTRVMVPYDSSMRLDFLAGRPMEVEAILGNPLRTATSHGFPMPHVETLYRQLKFLDRRAK